MDNLNYAFFESFKQLDKLCKEIYDDPHGVTQYVDDMKKSATNHRLVPNWNGDLEQLIRLRHIRNHLAHTEGAFQDDLCTQEDIAWIQKFHKRILEQEDPLAMLHRIRQSAVRTQNTISQVPGFPASQFIILFLVLAGIFLLVVFNLT